MRGVGLVVALLASGCGVAFMTPVEPPRPLQAPPGTGLVVFVRPSGWGGGNHCDLMDENGRFIGRSSGEAHFAVPVPPGRHMFVVWGENTDAVDVEVAPGKIYFVEVSIQPGFWSPSYGLYAITSRVKNWPKRDEWMRETRQMMVDVAGGQSLFAGRPGDVQERLRRAREHLQKYYGGPEHDKHFIRAEDGI